MVAGAFPVIKLATLGIKQLSKPVANFMKNRAKSSKWFRRYVCMPPAQIYHFWETRMKLSTLGLPKPKDVPKLNEEMAVELGAEMLGEFIVFMVGVATLYAEYARQSSNTESKENAQNQLIEDLNQNVKELTLAFENQNAQIRELERLVHSQTPQKKKA